MKWKTRTVARGQIPLRPLMTRISRKLPWLKLSYERRTIG